MGELKFNKFLRDILPGYSAYDFADKDRARGQYIGYFLNRTQSMFKWEGLPDTIPARMLELYLQTNGNACFYKYEGNLYVFFGGRGGTPDVYYMPTIYTIANPALHLNVMANIDIDCVVMPNDSMYMGLLPLFDRYATAMTETELSIDIACVNARIIDLIGAGDDRTRESAIKYLEDVRAGKLGVIATNEFLNGISATPYGATGHNTITDLIELMQYQKASCFNELGLNANYNMKRESLNSSESQLNNDALLPLIDDMLNCRKLYAEKVNNMFGTDISVEFNSSWEDNMQEIDASLQAITGGEPITEDNGSEGKLTEISEDDTKTYEIGTEDPEEPMNENQDITEEPEEVTEEEPTPEVIETEQIVINADEVVITEDVTEEPEEKEGDDDAGKKED